MAAAPLSPPSLARLGERATVAPRGRLQLIPKATIGFPAEVCESERGEMEKRSRQRVRDQVARLAFGAETRMRSSARGLSMMARNTNVPSGRIQKRKTNHLQIVIFGLQRAAGPYRWAISGLMHRSKVRSLQSPR